MIATIIFFSVMIELIVFLLIQRDQKKKKEAEREKAEERKAERIKKGKAKEDALMAFLGLPKLEPKSESKPKPKELEKLPEKEQRPSTSWFVIGGLPFLLWWRHHKKQLKQTALKRRL